MLIKFGYLIIYRNEIKKANIEGKYGTKKVLEKTDKNLPLLK